MIGTKLNNRYEVIELLGEGATSTVYKGLDDRLGREVALKVLHPHVRDTTRKRFFQEAMAAAQLNHAHIMAIYDRGEDNSRDYLVIEYVRGEPLTHHIPASIDLVIRLGAQIADALHYAHERDIIHRDIKPANIMVTPEIDIKIMDLGLALPREAKRVTAPGMVIGTPAYISPEQAKGKELDRRTDIYSLGIVLYEMATGQLPFNADDITALLLQHVQQQPPPPTLMEPSMPKALENIIMKTLEKDRERRFQTGKNLADTLRTVNAAHRKILGDDEDIMTMPSRSKDMGEIIDEFNSQEDIHKKATDEVKSRAVRDGMIRIVLADDHTLLRRTLANFLQTHPDIVVIDEASNGDEALEKVLQNQPDILLLDLNMPGRGGLDALPDIRKQAPDVKVLVLTGRDDDHYIMRALRAGAHGYVLKSTDEHKLVESIRKVMEDELILGSGIGGKLQNLLIPDENRLTDRELDVLLHVAAGMENDEISEKLSIGMVQLAEVTARLLDKMEVRDRHSAALKAIRTGLILMEDLHDLQTKT
ncbi:MAG: protein kinase [Anaerolineae bacterium]|nr:protein kinase [Anaerolineae bacterium]MDQ7035265.1 protein kinase [Anaerolineae bacterium]